MQLRKISKQAVIGGTLAIWCIKLVVRPYFNLPAQLKWLFGIAPNLIGSFLIPFGACWFFDSIFNLSGFKQLKATCLLGLLLIIINEYLQLIPFFGRTFDYLDILFSVLGISMGYLVFGRQMVKYRMRTYP